MKDGVLSPDEIKIVKLAITERQRLAFEGEQGVQAALRMCGLRPEINYNIDFNTGVVTMVDGPTMDGVEGGEKSPIPFPVPSEATEAPEVEAEAEVIVEGEVMEVKSVTKPTARRRGTKVG